MLDIKPNQLSKKISLNSLKAYCANAVLFANFIHGFRMKYSYKVSILSLDLNFIQKKISCKHIIKLPFAKNTLRKTYS